jgi:glutaredoxin
MKKIWLNFLFILGLILSTYGFLQKKFNLFTCQTDGCLISNELIKIDSSLLYVFAFLFFSILLVVFNKKTFVENLKEEIFYAGLIFESILFSYMFFIYNEFCIECAKMITLLIIIGFSINWKKMILFFSVISAIFILNPNKEKKLFKGEYNIITKNECPHCKKVKKYFKENNIKYNEINVKESISFLNTFNIRTVPVLVILKNNSIKIINGDLEIIKFVKNKNNSKIKINNNNLLNDLPFNNFEEGCSLTEKKKCS